MKVAIVGGGISGLVAALELAKSGIQCIVYEQDDDLGGFAKSHGTDKKFREHSYRAFGDFYQNLQDVCTQIGVQWPTAKSTLEAVPPIPFSINVYDVRMIFYILFGLLIPYDDTTSWYTMNKDCSPHFLSWLGKFNKAGSDYSRVSYGMMIRIIEMSLMQRSTTFRVSPNPVSTFLIDPLENKLRELGVIIRKGAKITSLLPSKLEADYVISTIPPSEYANILDDGALYSGIKDYFSKTTTETYQQEVAFTIIFKEKLNNVPKTGFDLHTSPWGILLMPADLYYNDSEWSTSVWNATCTFMNGKDVNGKTPLECKPQEFKDSVLTQCKELIQRYGGNVESINIWDEWYHGESELLSSDEITPVNSCTESQKKIDAGTLIGTNVILSGAHANTSTNIWLMESAAESGKLAATALLRKLEISSSINIYQHTRPRVYIGVILVVLMICLAVLRTKSLQNLFQKK